MKNQTCENWNDGASECCVYEKYTANRWEQLQSVEITLEKDKNVENDCSEFVEG